MNIKFIFDDINNCLKSIFFFWIFLLCFHLNLCSKYLLIIFFLIIAELLLKDTGESFLHHGLFNILALSFFLILGEILLLLFIYIIKIKNKKFLVFQIIIFLLLYIILYIKNKDKYFCKNWDRGLNNSFISNNKTLYPCYISIPKNKCFIDIISPLIDMSKILNIKCENRKEKEKYLLKSSSNLKENKTIKQIGFPITIINKEEIKGYSPLYGEQLYKYIMNNLINIDEKNISNNHEQNKQPELIVDFSENPYGELKQKIDFNENLSKDRLITSRKMTSNNILLLFFDNLSRLHFYRQYKKTSNFIKQFLSYKGYSTQNNSNQIYHGFEFLKYHKFKGSTLFNAIPMFTGVYFDKSNRMISIVKDMKKLGYITCNIQDVCQKELFGIGHTNNYSFIEFDHEYLAPSCDPNIYKIGYGLFSGENGILRKCLYGKESIEHSLDYGRQFWSMYKENNEINDY